jgi:hypothetical protein
MPHSSKKYRDARFCPSCGCESLTRDRYRDEVNDRPVQDGRNSFAYGVPEFVCGACGFGFRLGPSLRTEHANTMFKEHRKMRPPDE